MKWTALRKAALVTAIARGEIAADEARMRHALSAEELDGWRTMLARHGTVGLMVKMTKLSRDDERKNT